MKNNKVKTIYIHVGLHKTGTSSIQSTLAQNKNFLKKHSVYYPTKMGINHSEFLVPMFMDNPNEYYIEKSQRLHADIVIEEYRIKKECLVSELLEVEEETLLFSGEDIGEIDSEYLKKMKSFFTELYPKAEIKIILCLRNPSDYIASALQQSIKTGFCSSRPYAYKNIHFKTRIEKLSSIFSIENLILYSFENAKKHTKGLVGYFIEEILVLKKPSISEVQILRDNDSISDIVSNILGYLNEYTKSSVFAKGKDGGVLNYERYLNDTQALWGIKGDKYKFTKEYVESLYKQLEPELSWINEKFGIDYNLSNATYTEERYKIQNSFFETIKSAYPKLSRILRRAFYDWLCEEIKIREDKKELQQLEQTKRWIENRFKDTVKENLFEIKEKITREMDACKDFFAYFGIENKQNYQLYYHLHLLLKELGEYNVAKVMLQNFYEKNPYYNDVWEKSNSKIYVLNLKQIVKKIINTNSISFLFDKKENAYDDFKNVFYFDSEKSEILEQTIIFLKKHQIIVKSNK